jgi:hypothetical protein
MTNDLTIVLLRAFIKTHGHARGLSEKDVGLHSLRSSAAMAMYMNAIPVYTIMLLGQWSSDAFLLYIRKTVIEFSNDVSKRMINNRVYHHVMPTDREDPGTHNPMSAAANSGMGANGAAIIRRVFSIWG